MSTFNKKIFGFAAVVFGILVSATAVAHTDGIYNPTANSVGDTQGIDSNAASAVAPTFQGAGDVVSGATAWGSCARVYQASLASTATSLCDLVDSAAPTVTICTLRGTSTGFVDLTAYCPGSVTPAAKCAAATGGVCNVQKVYDQTGTGNHFTNVTAASQPTLAFSALNGLPGLSGVSASNTVLTSPAITQAQPFSMSFVAKRTAVTGLLAVLGSSGSLTGVGFDGGGGNSDVSAGAAVTEPATENVFHAVQGVLSSTVGANNTDGTDSGSISTGANTISAATVRVFRSQSASSMTGVIMEVGLWPSAFNATQRGNMNTNQHGAANGYNF